MSEHPRDEFDDVPEDGARQGAHRGVNPAAHSGSRREFRAIVVTGLLALLLGAVCFVNAPRTAQDASAAPSAAVAVGAVPASAVGTPGGSRAYGSPTTSQPGNAGSPTTV